MSRFTLRQPTGGHSLRDTVAAIATYVETIADLLALTTPVAGGSSDALVDENGDALVDEAGNPILVGEGESIDRLAHPEAFADTVSFADGIGGGTAYTASAATTLVLATLLTETFGQKTGNAYSHSGADRLVLTDSLAEAFNLRVVNLDPSQAGVWGRSQQWSCWVEFLVIGDVWASSAEGHFEVLGGKVTEDLTRPVTADLSLDLAFESNSTLLPTRLGDLLDPHGETVVRVWAGWKGHEQLMGYFDLASTPLRLTADGLTVSVTGMSFERVLQRAGFWTAENWAWNEWAVAAIVRLARDVLGAGLLVDWWPSVEFFGRLPAVWITWKPGDDRLGKMTEIAQAARMEFRINRHFVLMMRPTPSVENYRITPPAWEFLDGPGGTLLSITRESSDEESYNGVVVEGKFIDPDEWGLFEAAWIRDAASPLFFNPSPGPSTSRWGPRPKVIRTEGAVGSAQLQEIAAAELVKLSAVADQVTVTAPANTAIEVGQYARVRSAGLGIDAVYRIVRVVHDLAGGPLEATLNRAVSV